MFEDFITKLQNDRFFTLETTPEKAPSIAPIIEAIKQYALDRKFDGFSVTDNPLAKLKYSAILAAIRLQSEFNKPVITTMTMRDRNKIALQSDLLGANDFDIRTILALTGDKASMSDQPNAKGVFEENSLMLLRIIKCFNGGIDFAGRPLEGSSKPIYPFAVTNSHAKNFKTLGKKIKAKLERGAVGLITQPVYDIDNAKAMLELFEEVKAATPEAENAQLILGFFPITRFRTAQFLSSHVPGIYVPQEWVDTLYHAKEISDEEQVQVGMEMSKKLFQELSALHPKMHVMTANRFDVVNEIVDI
jgi:5,10-methylenetetrahydrofolate reductase